jgi:hypothetical protein
MPFFIPIMIAASVLSMVPSFIPHEEKRANQVISQDGNNYFNRQSMRNGNRTFNKQMRFPSGRNPYQKIDTNPSASTINYQQWIIYGGLGIVAIIALKFLMGRRN